MSRVDISSERSEIRALREQNEVLLDDGPLDPLLREIGVLAAVRRSPAETEARLDRARDAGLSDEMIEAISSEDWTDPAFDERTKIAFRFAMMYEAGHGISSSVFEGLQSQLDDAEILELAAVCSHWGSLARARIAFEAGP
ncbi:MAG: carboxymuconolactone decarboxylase family protein [Acidimicrobiales bacterium]